MKDSSKTETQKETVLVIDDDEFVRAIVTSLLEEAGFEVLQAEDGWHGLKLFAEHPADLVVTDILMPSKEGIETIRELRQRNRDVKIIAMSGGGSMGATPILHAAQEFGADAVLSKPFSRTDLLETIRNLRDA